MLSSLNELIKALLGKRTARRNHEEHFLSTETLAKAEESREVSSLSVHIANKTKCLHWF